MESDFQYTTLVVFQQNNFFQNETLARMYTSHTRWRRILYVLDLRKLTRLIRCVEGYQRDKTEVTWEVGALPGSDGLDGTFHFELRDGVDPDCEGCSLNSGNFVVSRRKAGSATTTSSATAGPRPTDSGDSRTSGTSTSSPTAAVAGTRSTASATPVKSKASGNDLGVGLGVGLGLGIPLLLVIAGVVFYMRRRRRRRNSLPRGRQPSPATSSDRASGALLYQDGRQSQQSTPFRPSTAARSERSAWSHRSWIQPFEFEQAEMRDQDAISQLRQSIYSNSRSRRSQVNSSHEEQEWSMLEGIPEQPHAVYDGGDGGWPLRQ